MKMETSEGTPGAALLEAIRKCASGVLPNDLDSRSAGAILESQWPVEFACAALKAVKYELAIRAGSCTSRQRRNALSNTEYVATSVRNKHLRFWETAREHSGN